MTKVLKWLMANQVPVEQHLQSRNVSWLPLGAWLITSGCLCRVMKLVDVAIVKLQGRQLQLAMQREILAGRSINLCKLGKKNQIYFLRAAAVFKLQTLDPHD